MTVGRYIEISYCLEQRFFLDTHRHGRDSPNQPD